MEKVMNITINKKAMRNLAITIAQVAAILATIASVAILFLSIYFLVITDEVNRIWLLGAVASSMELGAAMAFGYMLMPKR